jgi:hypothetical protein
MTRTIQVENLIAGEFVRAVDGPTYSSCGIRSPH